MTKEIFYRGSDDLNTIMKMYPTYFKLYAHINVVNNRNYIKHTITLSENPTDILYIVSKIHWNHMKDLFPISNYNIVSTCINKIPEKSTNKNTITIKKTKQTNILNFFIKK